SPRSRTAAVRPAAGPASGGTPRRLGLRGVASRRSGHPAGPPRTSSTRRRRPAPAVQEVITMSNGKTILASLRQHQNITDYRKIHWEGSFEEYLDIVREHPEVTRTAYQRLYDMIL